MTRTLAIGVFSGTIAASPVDAEGASGWVLGDKNMVARDRAPDRATHLCS